MTRPDTSGREGAPHDDDPPRHADPRTRPDLGAWRDSFTEKWRADVEARLAAARERSAQIKARMADASYEATSRDRLATVRVGASGGLLGVTVSERARSATPVQISQAIMSAYRAAAAEAMAQSTEMVRELAGEQAAQQLRAVLPDLDDPENAP